MREQVQQKTGAVRRFGIGDIEKPYHGWKSVGVGLWHGLVNTKGWAAVHVVVQKLIEGAPPKDYYDQVIIIENPGAIVVCRAGDRVGLVQNFRFTAERLMDANSEYVRRLTEERRWDELLGSLGRWQWELPRGLSPAAAGTDLSKFILATAKVEAQEEAGYGIGNARICGKVNANSTFFAHPQYVVAADIETAGDNRPEDLEMIGKARLFGAEEIRAMTDADQFDDGLSIAALALAGFAF